MTAPSCKVLRLGVLLMIAAAPGWAAGAVIKPTISAAVPARIEVNAAADELLLVLQGEHFLIEGNSPVWNAREVILFVRHTARGAAWQGLYNSLRDGGQPPGTYPNPPREFGRCYYDSDRRIRVWLPRSIWCSRPGTLEFLVVKGKFGNGPPPMMLVEAARSPVFGVPVRADVSGITRIDRITPTVYWVHQENPPLLTVSGHFDSGTAVLLDNAEVVTAGSNPQTGVISVRLIPGMLEREALHTVRLRDSQGTVSNMKTFWVYGRTRVTAVTPAQLTAGKGRQEIKVRFGGMPPESLWARVDCTNDSGSCPHPPPRDWKELTVNFPSSERISIVLEGGWTRCPGTLHLRLVGRAGDSMHSLPIVALTPPVRHRPPAGFVKAPVSAHWSAVAPAFRPRLKKLAQMVVDLKAEKEIRRCFLTLLQDVTSGTKDSLRGGRAALENLQSELEKEVRARERNRRKKLTGDQQRRIRSLLDMLRRMARIRTGAAGQIIR